MSLVKDFGKVLPRLKRVLPAGEISFEDSVLARYGGDKWFATHKPDAVALPRSVKSVSTLLRFANEHRIPVTPRGAGYGYVGGCVPIKGGIVLSLERMNRIKEINEADFVAVVEAGVITKICRTPSRKRAFTIRLTPPAAPTLLSAAISPPMPADRAA